MIEDDARVATALRAVGRRSPRQLAPTRRWLHFALQPVAAHGFSLVETAADFHHTAEHWVRERRAIVGEAASSAPHFRAGLAIAEGALLLLDEHDEVRDRFVPTGATLDDTYRWYEAAATRLRGRPLTLVRP